uniref:AP complex subunit beta n=1 Tax=Sinocyclocheilus grahami TaxID=75366 RepID=A0A672TBA7_SINGR
MPYFGSEETVKELKRALSNPNVHADRLRYKNYISKVIRMKDLDSWAQSEVLTFLLRYRPRSDDQLFDILSLLDSFLQSAHAHVTVATLRLFLQLASAHPAVQADALLRTSAPLLATCGAASRELRFAGLCHVQQVMRSQPGLFGTHYKRFFCGYSEPTYIKFRKMEILVELVNDENVSLVLEELRSYCTDVSPELAQAAIAAIGRIARTYSEKCLDILTGLLALKQDHITSAVIQTFRDLVWFCPQSTAAVCQTVEACVDSPQDSEGKQALLWLLGEHGDQISSAPYVMEGYIDGLKTELSSAVKMELLTASVKMFLCRPAETQDMLGRLLHYCIEEESDVCVRDRALLCYRLLQRGVEETRKVVTGPKSDPSMSVLTGRQEEPISQWTATFNTLGPLSGRDLCPQTAVISAADQPSSSAEKELLPDEEISLSLGSPLSHETFEKMWLDLEILHRQTLGSPRPRTAPDTLQAALQLVKIQTLAFTPGDTVPWKAYIYTRSTGTLILAELLQGDQQAPGSDESLVVSVKQQPVNQHAIRGFVSILKSVLQTLNVDSS